MNDTIPVVPLQTRPPVIVMGLRWVRRGSVIASVDLYIPRIDLELHECCWGRTDGRDWVATPTSARGSKDGRTHYARHVRWRSRETADRFQAAALAALSEFLTTGENERPLPKLAEHPQ